MADPERDLDPAVPAGPGRKPWKPSAQQRAEAQRLRQDGASIALISAMLGVAWRPLRRELAAEIGETWHTKKLRERALAGDADAAIAYIERRGDHDPQAALEVFRKVAPPPPSRTRLASRRV
jgi:hypothetical protein